MIVNKEIEQTILNEYFKFNVLYFLLGVTWQKAPFLFASQPLLQLTKKYPHSKNRSRSYIDI